MNEESLARANRFLAAVVERIPQGEFLETTPAEIGKSIGLPDPLSAARAVRALLARRRLEAVDGKYRLLDVNPVQTGEPEAIPRAPRRKKEVPERRERSSAEPGRATYSDVGREAIDRLIELGREVGTLRGSLRTAREEVRQSREARDEAERRAASLGGRLRESDAKLEMAEANLRTLLAAARGTPKADTVGDAEMDAILSVLKTGREN